MSRLGTSIGGFGRVGGGGGSGGGLSSIEGHFETGFEIDGPGSTPPPPDSFPPPPGGGGGVGALNGAFNTGNFGGNIEELEQLIAQLGLGIQRNQGNQFSRGVPNLGGLV